MKDHIGLAPVATTEQRRIRYVRGEKRNVWAIWTLIVGGCTLSLMAIASALKLPLPF